MYKLVFKLYFKSIGDAEKARGNLEKSLISDSIGFSSSEDRVTSKRAMLSLLKRHVTNSFPAHAHRVHVSSRASRHTLVIPAPTMESLM